MNCPPALGEGALSRQLSHPTWGKQNTCFQVLAKLLAAVKSLPAEAGRPGCERGARVREGGQGRPQPQRGCCEGLRGPTSADPGFRNRVASLSCLHWTRGQAGLTEPCQAWGSGLCSQTLGKGKRLLASSHIAVAFVWTDNGATVILRAPSALDRRWLRGNRVGKGPCWGLGPLSTGAHSRGQLCS